MFSIYFIGCIGDPFEYPPNEYDLYSFEIDATDFNDDEGYFLFRADEYVERINAGDKRRIAFYYYAGTLCQLDMNKQYNCVTDTNKLTQVILPIEKPLKDLIKVDYKGQVETLQLNRRQPFIDNYFAVDLPEQDSIFTLPAIPMDTNRIIIHHDNDVIIDTSFFVGNDTINLAF